MWTRAAAEQVPVLLRCDVGGVQMQTGCVRALLMAARYSDWRHAGQVCLDSDDRWSAQPCTPWLSHGSALWSATTSGWPSTDRKLFTLNVVDQNLIVGTGANVNGCALCSVSATASKQHLRSAASHQLMVPSYRLSFYSRSVCCRETHCQSRSDPKRFIKCIFLFTVILVLIN